ncbi:hypothetical protein HII36_29825 [Nonomuraea sp. NN258]|uniref:hypothetical protein n=1 Tax=Nonomuraea antri TaxID=2730852 RepID=UPI001567EC76|nr:hypothetical protein [Nonomuraea antri]NRQ36000.1 hypothetical protein [Nonomuraea antri]
MRTLTSTTTTATAVRNNRATVYEVEYDGAVYTRVAFGEYLFAVILDTPNGREAEWARTWDEAVSAAKGGELVAVVTLTQPKSGEPMHEIIPSGCAWCGIDKRDHSQRWTEDAGWHRWTAPADWQIKARMAARRASASS